MNDELGEPCAWCLDVDKGALLQCRCDRECGKPDCPMAERELYAMQPVPTFIDRMNALVEYGQQLAEESWRLVEERLVEESPPPLPGDQALTVLRLVEELHARCPCKVCSAGIARPVCSSCSDFWPCKTMNLIRGVTNVDGSLKTQNETAGSLGLT